MTTSGLVLETLIQSAHRKLDLSARADVVEWALSRVEKGDSTPGLVELASLPSREVGQVDVLLTELLAQFGQAEPSQSQSAMLVAGDTVRQLE